MTRQRAWLLALTLVACGGKPASHASDTVVVAPPSDSPDHTGGHDATPSGPRLLSAHRIDSPETWHRLAARPENHVVARTEVVKFLIDLAYDRTIYFTDTERYPIHYRFARDHLSTAQHPIGRDWRDHEYFNEHEYRQPDRRFEMGSVVHYLDSDIWALEMIAGDNLPGDRVVRVFEQIRGAVYFGAQLRYRPMSALHEELTASVRDQLPMVSAQDVFGSLRYQPLTRGVTYGTLRFVRGPLDLASVRPDEILVLEQLPDEIPVVSGVISQELQAPLGHIAILCGTRGTPNMGLRGALSDPRLTALEGRIVRLSVDSQDFVIAPASREDAERAWAARRPSHPMSPNRDDSDHGLPAMCDLRYADARFAGAKAAQLGEACAIRPPAGVVPPPPPIRTPGGFVVPFHHYLRHLERTGLARGLQGMLTDAAFRSDAHVREQRLSELRAAIQRAPVDPSALRAIARQIRAFPGSPRVILRSSTNAEDLPGFTGAGLYRSIVIGGNASDAEIANALREVWASVWLQGAYEEREWYRIDHQAVAMAVLVQPFVDGAVANGVALTANPFFEGRPGFFVNAQALGGSVTGAAGEEIPEQHLIYTYQGIETELISRSSRTGGQPLMSEQELIALAGVLQQLHDTFTALWAAHGNVNTVPNAVTAAEVEFLIAGPDRHVVVLQARPFAVVYGEGQL
ncbi:MAG: PEP/pyruvate-binding domain-containing protein [Sandaracinaceae bacterium]